MGYKPEVQTAGDGDAWTGNALVFATKEESDSYGLDLCMRWTAVKDIRSTETDEPVNCEFTENGTKHLR